MSRIDALDRDPIARLLLAGALLAAGATGEVGGPEEIFADGFELGDGCGWSARPPIDTESFDAADGEPLPAPYLIVGGLEVADVQQGRARLRPVPSPIAPGRVVAAIPTSEVDVRFRFWLEDVSRQGVGFYVRQNGGYLTATVPAGEGYSVFLEGFTGDSLIGLWRERAGNEEPLVRLPAPFDYADGAPYRARFRVSQLTPTRTLLEAKVWGDVDPEPPGWQVTFVDATASLQNVEAGIALDVFTLTGGPGSPSGYVDDISIDDLCSPLEGRGELSTIADDLLFAEGPLWRDDHLLFSDLGTPGVPPSAEILRLDPPATITPVRSPSGFANGLATASNGSLLACEHAARRLSTSPDVASPPATLVGDYLGDAFNSPNDLAVRSDGTVYFTDPSYGMAAHGQPREIAFNGLFRLPPVGALTAEWQGVAGTNEPNGVALSPDERRLYATDTATGRLLAWEVAVDGTLTGPSVLRQGLDTPDGLCLDIDGNLFVATWDRAIEVLSPAGERFGRIELPRDATNCAFGGADRRTLYITALDQLYAVDLARPGAP